MKSVAVSLVLAGALILVAFSLPAAAERPRAEDALGRTGELNSRPDGLPTTSEPARRLRSARVIQDFRALGVRGTFVLAGTPAAGTIADLHVTLGNLSGNSCMGEEDISTPTAGTLADGFSRSGATISLDTAKRSDGANFYGPWNCAFAALTVAGQPPAAGTTYDVLIGPQNAFYGKPRLRIGRVELLSANVKRLRLVPGVWTTFEVTVRNSGTAAARRIRVFGRGRGIRVKAAGLGTIQTGDYKVADVRIRLNGRRRGGLRLVARSGAVSATRRLGFVSVRSPRRPVSGNYESKDGSVTFTIARGRLIGWRGYMQTQCGGYPGLPRYTMNTYDFPTVRIPRNGIVTARQRGHLFRAYLELRAVGGRVSRGYFSYSGPDRCFASTSFDARLKRGR